MKTPNATPKDLAKIVAKKLKSVKTHYTHPSEAVLHELFENLFFTSLKTEEAQLIRVTITLIDSANPDPHPPQRITADRWNFIRFEKPVPFTVKNLTKLSKAADPWSSSLAVYYDENNEIFIWGMIDQAIHYQSFLNYESESGPEQPGLFQATIADIGNIHVMIDYELIANLKQNYLISNYIDVFQKGPVSEIIHQNSEHQKKPIISHLKKELASGDAEEWVDYVEYFISQTISRILIRIQNYHHGGAFIISNGSKAGLDIKHKLSYDRLSNAVVRLTQLTATNYEASSTIVSDFLETDEETMPISLYLQEDISRFEKDDTNSELKGAIRFIASLSCIDGLVVLTPKLEVQGFGAVIKSKAFPSQIHVSQTPHIVETKLQAVNPDHFGTRHRSMFSYCWSNTGSLGFVVSQDGEIRAITRVSDKLIMWENVKVQQFLKSEKIKKSIRSKLNNQD